MYDSGTVRTTMYHYDGSGKITALAQDRPGLLGDATYSYKDFDRFHDLPPTTQWPESDGPDESFVAGD